MSSKKINILKEAINKAEVYSKHTDEDKEIYVFNDMRLVDDGKKNIFAMKGEDVLGYFPREILEEATFVIEGRSRKKNNFKRFQ